MKWTKAEVQNYFNGVFPEDTNKNHQIEISDTDCSGRRANGKQKKTHFKIWLILIIVPKKYHLNDWFERRKNHSAVEYDCK